jgi:hypothetical protein
MLEAYLIYYRDLKLVLSCQYGASLFKFDSDKFYDPQYPIFNGHLELELGQTYRTIHQPYIVLFFGLLYLLGLLLSGSQLL